MKRTLIIAFAALSLSACDQQGKEKAQLDAIMKIHDKVMGHDEDLMKNKMKLDTLLQPGKMPAGTDTIIERGKIRALEYVMGVADDAMERWMKNFQPDQKGKPHDVIMDYYTDQKKQVMAVDSQLRVAIDQSGDYLKGLKK